MAPLNTVKAVRLIPTLPSAVTIATAIRSTFNSLANSTCSDGVSASTRRMRRSASCEAVTASQSRIASAAKPRITVKAEIRKPAKSKPIESRNAIVAVSRPRMLSAAMVQTETAIRRPQAGLRTKLEVRRMTIHAASRLSTRRSRWLGKPA